MRAAIALAVCGVAIGLFVRCTNVERKLFWSDEAYTALLVSGHREADLLLLFDGRPVPARAVAALQQRAPGSSIESVMRALAATDPQHATLFDAVDRAAIDTAGSTVGAYRWPSVLSSLLAVGLAFWLGVELFEHRLGGAVLAALVAVSPLQALYAHQAREYAMMTAAMLLATIALVRALRRPGTGRWCLYAVTVAIGLYVDALVALLLVAHAFTCCWIARRDRARLVSFAIAAGAALAAFSPWALNAVLSHRTISDETSWGQVAYPLTLIAEKWLFNVGAVFFDAEFASLRLAPIAAVCAAIAAAAVVVVVRSGGRAAAVAIPLIVVTFGVFLGHDAIAHAHFSTIPRYLFAGWIGLELATAAALTAGIRARRPIALAAFAVLLVAGGFSVVLESRYENWWDNNDQIALQAVARRVDAAPRPLVIAERSAASLPLVLARYLRPDDELVLVAPGRVPSLPADRSAFVLAPSEPMRAAIARRYTLVNVSPQAANAITSFHATLKASRVAVHGLDVYTAENALWSIRPHTHSQRAAPSVAANHLSELAKLPIDEPKAR